jgi:hypothetical protein
MPPLKLIQPIKVSELIIPAYCGEDFGNVSYSLDKVGITQSLLGNFQCCRKCFLLKLHRWESLEKERKTGYGSLMHEILGTVYTGFMNKVFSYNDFIDVITSVIDQFTFNKLWDTYSVEIAKAKAQAIAEVYIKVFKKDFEDFRFEGIEEVLEVSFQDAILRGKVDGKFRDKHGGIWNMEHKNYGRINPEIMPMLLNFDMQNLFYMLVEEIKNNSRLKGTFYNIIRNPQVRKKDGDASEVYRLIKQKVTNDPAYFFYRYWIPYSRKQFESFKKELSCKLDDIQFALSVDEWYQNQIFYKNEQGCYGMNYACDFIQACSMDSLNGYIQKQFLFGELQ